MHEGAAQRAQVERRETGVEALPVLAQVLAGVVGVVVRARLRAEAMAAQRRLRLEAVRARGRIGGDAEGREVGLALEQVLVDDERSVRRAVDGRGEPAAVEIGHVLRTDAPVETVCEVGVGDLAGDVAQLAIALERHGQVAIAQHVAEVERRRAGRVGAETVDADADRRLTDVLELQLGLVRLRRDRRFRGGQARVGILEHCPRPGSRHACRAEARPCLH